MPDMRHQVKANPRLKDLKEMFALQPAEMKVLVRTLDTEFVRQRKRQFATEGAAAGSKFPALSADYKKAKDRKFPGRKIMQRTGKMRRQFVTKNAPGHVAKWYNVGRGPVVVLGGQGRDAQVAAYHIQKSGNPLRNPNLPDRDVMDSSPRQDRKMSERVADFLTEKRKRVERVMNIAAAQTKMRMKGR